MTDNRTTSGAGVVMDVRVGEELTITGADGSCARVVVEKKEGQRARLRVIAPRSIIVGRPAPRTAA